MGICHCILPRDLSMPCCKKSWINGFCFPPKDEASHFNGMTSFTAKSDRAVFPLDRQKMLAISLDSVVSCWWWGSFVTYVTWAVMFVSPSERTVMFLGAQVPHAWS
jgi:hypothetical protein